VSQGCELTSDLESAKCDVQPPKNKRARQPCGRRARKWVVGVRHALFPGPTLGASSHEGCRLPDAILHGKRSFRPRSRAVPRIAAAEFRVRLFSSLRLVVAPPACEPGQDTPVIAFASSPLSAGSAADYVRAFALCHGSRLFTLRLRFFTGQRCLFRHRRLGGRFFTRPAETSCPSRIECSLCPAFRRLSFSRPSFPKTARVIRSVLVRSNNRLPFGQLRFAQRPKPPLCYFTRLAAASYRCSSRGFLFA